MKFKKIKNCYKHLKWDINYTFIQTDAKISYKVLAGLVFLRMYQKFWLG